MAQEVIQRVEVTRQFWHKAEPLGVGTVVDLPLPLAIEMRSANKVKFVQADTKLKSERTLKRPVDGSLPAKPEPKE